MVHERLRQFWGRRNFLRAGIGGAASVLGATLVGQAVSGQAQQPTDEHAAHNADAHAHGNALLVGLLTMIGDTFSHPGHYGIPHLEAVVTGVVSGLLALAGSFVFEDRARRLRALWARIRGREPQHR